MRAFSSFSTGCLLTVMFVMGCSVPPEPEVQFELRGLSISAEESETFTAFTRKGTVVATGKDAKQLYNVLYRVKHVSGGDPSKVSTSPRFVGVLVFEGVGDYEESAGLRDKKTSYREAETWEPEQVELIPVGFDTWHAWPRPKK